MSHPKKNAPPPFRRLTKRKMTPAQLANLRPFIKGQVANPKGRPKGTTIVAALQKKLRGRVRDLFAKAAIQSGKTGIDRRILNKQVSDAIAELTIKQVLRGNLDWLLMVLQRTEGAIGQKVTVDTPGRPLTPEEAAAAIEAAYAREEAEKRP